jgi:hypothetical protein
VFTSARPYCTVLSIVVLTTAAAAQPPITQPSWLAGCWRQDGGERVIDEFWMPPAGGLMLGTGRTVAKGRVVEFEFMQIREEAGKLVFTAKPSGQPEASFPAIRTGAREVVFENLAHDFPQRVIYRIDGDTLTGRIEGTQNGKPRSVDYPMRRVACASGG